MGFDTTFLVCVNKLVLEQCAEQMAGLPIPKFLSWAGLGLPLDSPTTTFLHTSGGIGFSADPLKIVYESATVTNVCLQLAYYMGFSTAILIGVDHSFSTKGTPHTTVVSAGPDQDHFSPNYFGKGFRWQLPDLDTSEKGYALARHAYEDDGREVLDATVGGKLEIFPKVQYKDLFAHAD